MLWEDLAGPPKREKPEAGFYSRSSVYRLDLQEVTKVVQSRIVYSSTRGSAAAFQELNWTVF